MPRFVVKEHYARSHHFDLWLDGRDATFHTGEPKWLVHLMKED